MPLLDHFHPPWKKRRPWEGFHSTWASMLVQRLNHGWLPPHYFAVPQVRLGGQVEVDVATVEEEQSHATVATGAATAVWAPPKPSLSAEIDCTQLDLFEIQIFDEHDTPKLVAAIELVSPANKDRHAHRQAFVIKCGSYLQANVGVLIVDVVTSRTGNLHRQLLELLQMNGEEHTDELENIYAASYRTIGADGTTRLEVWTEPLAIGRPLPTMPLWLNDVDSVRVDLEAAYVATCDTLLMT